MLYIVIPCYNEEEILKYSSEELKKKAIEFETTKAVTACKIMFVNDGSTDSTWDIIKKLHQQDSNHFTGLSLSKNKGQQTALFAGISEAVKHADIIITMDVDLQDDINAINTMIDKHINEKCDVVYGVRRNRETDTLFKRITARGFYKFMSVMGAEMVYDHADFRLLSKRAALALTDFTESDLFLRGVVPLIGFKSDKVYYDRKKRIAGESKYPLKKMLSFAINGITSFSTKPLRMILFFSVVMGIVSLIFFIKIFFTQKAETNASEWLGLMCSVWFIGSVQTACISVIGEYIGKIYSETKKRPRYFIDENLE